MRKLIYAINITLDGCVDHTKQTVDDEKMEYFTSKVGIELMSTAAEIPWSNGLCEKNVGILKESLRKLQEDGWSLKEGIKWATHAKNSLSNHLGFATNQLVLGYN